MCIISTIAYFSYLLLETPYHPFQFHLAEYATGIKMQISG